MKKNLFFLMLFIMCSLMCQAQYSDIDKNTPFQRVQLRKRDTPDMFPKSGMVWFSEKPNGEEAGYYGVQTANGFVYDGKGNKVRTSSMKSLGNGWYEYDFNKTLYLRRIGDLAHMENVRFCVESSPSSQSNQTSSTKGKTRATATVEEKGTEVPPLVMLTPKPNLVETGWTLTETTQKDGVTCETYTKEIEDEDVYRYLYRRGDGEFIVSDKKVSLEELFEGNFWKNDFKWKTGDGSTLLWKKDMDKLQEVYPNGIVYEYFKEKGKSYDYNHSLEQFRDDYSYMKVLYMLDNPATGYRIEKGKEEGINSYPKLLDDPYGVLIGDRFYLTKGEKLIPVFQKMKGINFPICSTDTIVDIKSIENKDTILNEKKYKYNSIEVIYKNGDHYKYVYLNSAAL